MMHDPLDHQDMMLGDQFFSSKKVSSIFWMLELTQLYLKYALLCVCGLAQCDSNYDVATTMNSGIEWNSLFSFMKSRNGIFLYLCTYYPKAQLGEYQSKACWKCLSLILPQSAKCMYTYNQLIIIMSSMQPATGSPCKWDSSGQFGGLNAKQQTAASSATSALPNGTKCQFCQKRGHSS